MEEELEDRDKDLSRFLAKVDEVGALVSELSVSGASEEALRRADSYLDQRGRERVVHNRTLINTAGTAAPVKHREKEEFMKTLEEDARERGERRKQRETKGKEHKRKGNSCFRAGQYQSAVEEFSTALEYTPWDISLYTNRALAHNQLGQYSDAIVDCDAALKLEPSTLKAYLQKAKALTHLHRELEADECYSEAERLFPSRVDHISSIRKSSRC